MNETLSVILVFAAGLMLGVLFFGGLWFTVKKAVTSKLPALWMVGGFIIRAGITLVGFYYVSLGNWQWLLICLLGFVIARMLVLKITKIYDQKNYSLNAKNNHEA